MDDDLESRGMIVQIELVSTMGHWSFSTQRRGRSQLFLLFNAVCAFPGPPLRAGKNRTPTSAYVFRERASIDKGPHPAIHICGSGEVIGYGWYSRRVRRERAQTHNFERRRSGFYRQVESGLAVRSQRHCLRRSYLRGNRVADEWLHR